MMVWVTPSLPPRLKDLLLFIKFTHQIFIEHYHVSSTVLNAGEMAGNGPETGSDPRGLSLYLTVTPAQEVVYLHFTDQEAEAQK